VLSADQQLGAGGGGTDGGALLDLSVDVWSTSYRRGGAVVEVHTEGGKVEGGEEERAATRLKRRREARRQRRVSICLSGGEARVCKRRR
jgi:hypothetical protein